MLDGDHVMRAAPGDQVLRMGALSVHRVRSDHRAG
jgi:hypothetical protein